MMFAIIAQLKLIVWQIDFTGAYLNADIDHTIHMEQLQGFVLEGDDRVCLLIKALYRMMQAGHLWGKTLDETYQKGNFTKSLADPCIRFKRKGEEYTLTGTYTDDVKGASSTAEGALNAKDALKKHWELTDSNDLNLMLGVTVTQDKELGNITLSQSAYFERMLKVFSLFNLNPAPTPLILGLQLERIPYPLPPDEVEFMADKLFRPLLGSVMWGQASTRPDLSFAVSFLAQFQDNPGNIHWNALIHACRYIKGTLDYRIVYRGPRNNDTNDFGTKLKPYIYADVDYAGCLDTRRSTLGCIGIMASGPTVWASKRQQCITTSTTGAEYVSLGKAAEQAVWMSSWMDRLDLLQEKPVVINGDNLASISIVEDHSHHQLSKHIYVQHHFIQELVATKQVLIQSIPSKQNRADILTKPLSPEAHDHIVQLLRVLFIGSLFY